MEIQRCGALVTYMNEVGGYGRCTHKAKAVRGDIPVCKKHERSKLFIVFDPAKNYSTREAIQKSVMETWHKILDKYDERG
jgi:hypothetical protein